ncbi:hypothetical protein VSR68_03290 [Paraburkholderia phymatum]|uniref:hypothetical protein n=1 Tax=Paraburkholderia phymatum TaxID=148447 RepID=UPI0031716D22
MNTEFKTVDVTRDAGALIGAAALVGVSITHEVREALEVPIEALADAFAPDCRELRWL